MDPDQTAPIGAVCSGSMLFASILNSPVMLGDYLQQTTSADDIFRCIFFLGAFRVNIRVCAFVLKRITVHYLHFALISREAEFFDTFQIKP